VQHLPKGIALPLLLLLLLLLLPSALMFSCALMAAAVLASVLDRFDPLRSRRDVGNTTAVCVPNSL
jgi:hypothetical protein